ncbi:MAG: hypothetical protein GQ570_13980 [Helicobacteraceae bacterium]|nr:hypothetical protein [Helicobacteraceae bacterium]
MQKNLKTSKYPSKNIKTETYKDGDTIVTKHYYDTKDAQVKEVIYLKNGIKQINHITLKGVEAKQEHFIEGKREGVETKYFIAKANGSIKSTKMYDDGKLHGENITYNEKQRIIKHEVYAQGKRVLKYLREDGNVITSVEIIDKDSVVNLPKIEYEKLQSYI